MWAGFKFLILVMNGWEDIYGWFCYLNYNIDLLVYVCILFEVGRVNYIYGAGVGDFIVNYNDFVMLV